jgi:hypothetical protein
VLRCRAVFHRGHLHHVRVLPGRQRDPQRLRNERGGVRGVSCGDVFTGWVFVRTVSCWNLFHSIWYVVVCCLFSWDVCEWDRES